jgi:hypothetical protein
MAFCYLYTSVNIRYIVDSQALKVQQNPQQTLNRSSTFPKKAEG